MEQDLYSVDVWYDAILRLSRSINRHRIPVPARLFLARDISQRFRTDVEPRRETEEGAGRGAIFE